VLLLCRNVLCACGCPCVQRRVGTGCVTCHSFQVCGWAGVWAGVCASSASPWCPCLWPCRRAVDMSDPTSIVSPGGVGFDINCGVRLLRTNLTEEDVAPVKEQLAQALFDHIPVGVGSKGIIPTDTKNLEAALVRGGRGGVCVTSRGIRSDSWGGGGGGMLRRRVPRLSNQGMG
jgi:hypothetical protein